MKLCRYFLVGLACLLHVTAERRENDAEKHDLYMKNKREEANQEYWIEQKLNHFDEFDRRTWMQRYLKTDAFYKNGGPVFLLIGGETDSFAFFLESDSLLMRATRKFGAMLFYLEHRYYGKSRPTEDIRVENLRYLTVRLALEDLANFIQNLKTISDLSDSTIVVFGTSYSGALAGWARSKYPHLIYGAVAISPPFEAKLFFHQYASSVNETLFQYGGNECHKAIQKANEETKSLMKYPRGHDRIKKIFNLCENSSLHGLTMELFHSILNNHVNDVIQYSRGNIILEEPRVYMTIEEMCEIMSDESYGPEIYRFAHFIALRLNSTDCLEVDFSADANSNRNTTWGPNSGDRIWLYQTCTEFGWFQTISGKPFQTVRDDFPVNLCVEVFGPTLTAQDVLEGPKKTNLELGGLEIAKSATRLVVWNGGVDPWHEVSCWEPNVIIDTMKVRKPVIDRTCSFSNKWWELSDFRHPLGFSTIFTPGGSHCEVFAASSEKDSVELSNSRSAIIGVLAYWLNGEQTI